MNPLRHGGFSLLEVLIAIVIVSLGLLGNAAIHLRGLKDGNAAFQQNQAANLAHEMADRLRANLQGVRDGEYDDLSGIPEGDVSNCANTVCSPAELAQYDLSQWNNALAATLPVGQGTVCRRLPTAASCAGTGDTFVITVRWDAARSGATGTGCDRGNSDDLHCQYLVVSPGVNP
ncbi:MAG: type IV pilus modification protein PilV [Chromatiales bacterium]|nr:type IV pilus modification protein PilV [Chromatiales bacterium]